jgi:hypothetical protein
VCGWYFRPDFYRLLGDINEKYPVTVVNNGTFSFEPGIFSDKISLTSRQNIGLEWGAYDYFLKTKWDNEADVLFLHDDIRFRPVIMNYELVEPMIIFDTIAKLEFDQVYLFGSLDEATANYGIHGRAFKCSVAFLKYLLEHNNGFWFDKNNDGHIQGPTPDYCEHYNKADYKFADCIKELDGKMPDLMSRPRPDHVSTVPPLLYPARLQLDVGEYVILPALDCAVRGRFREEIEGIMDEEI